MTNQLLINSCQSSALVSLTRSVPFLNNKQTNYKLSSHRAVYKRFNYNFAKWTESESESKRTALCWLIRIELVSLPVGMCVRRAMRRHQILFMRRVCLWITSLRFAKETFSLTVRMRQTRRGKWEFPTEANSWLLNASPKSEERSRLGVSSVFAHGRLLTKNWEFRFQFHENRRHVQN